MSNNKISGVANSNNPFASASLWVGELDPDADITETTLVCYIFIYSILYFSTSINTNIHKNNNNRNHVHLLDNSSNWYVFIFSFLDNII